MRLDHNTKGLLVKYHQFPNTNLSVSQLCFGCWGVISDTHWGSRAEEDSLSAMRRAIDSGVNFFDTAPMYGDGASETLLGEFLNTHDLRTEIVVASKIRPNKMRPEEVFSECEESLRRLQTDYLDLYQTHWTSREVPLSETWGAMQELQRQGKVRHIGVCNAGVHDLGEVLSVQKPLTNQLPYNLLWRMIEGAILPQCRQEEVSVLVYSPLMHGILAGNYQTPEEVPDGRARTRHFSATRPLARHGEEGCEAETFAALQEIRRLASDQGKSMAHVALAWTIQQQGVASVIAGARDANQVQANLEFVDNPLPVETLADLEKVTQALKQTLGDNPDMWDAGDQARYR